MRSGFDLKIEWLMQEDFVLVDLSMFIWLENGLNGRESVKSEVVAIGESDQKKNLIRSNM